MRLISCKQQIKVKIYLFELYYCYNLASFMLITSPYSIPQFNTSLIVFVRFKRDSLTHDKVILNAELSVQNASTLHNTLNYQDCTNRSSHGVRNTSLLKKFSFLERLIFNLLVLIAHVFNAYQTIVTAVFSKIYFSLEFDFFQTQKPAHLALLLARSTYTNSYCVKCNLFKLNKPVLSFSAI